MFILEWYHAMFPMQGTIFMHFTPSPMINYVAIIPGKDDINSDPERHVYESSNTVACLKFSQEMRYYLNTD